MEATSIRQRQHGVIATEVAILTPFALLFLILIIEFGLFFLYLGRLQMVSYNSARYAAEQWQQGNNAGLITKAKRVAVYGVPVKTEWPVLPGLTEQSVELNFTSMGRSNDGHISVTIQYAYQPVFPSLVLVNIDLLEIMKVESVMRVFL